MMDTEEIVMVKRGKDIGGPAVAEMPKRSAADIAEAIGREQLQQQRDQIRQDVESWRTLVHSVSDGHEPDGATLLSIGELSARLKAPADSIATGVSMVQRDRDFEQQMRTAAERLRETKLREPELRRELEEARARLRALEAEAADFTRVARTVPDIAQARQENRAKAPLLFADIDAVVEQLLKADAVMSNGSLNSLKQQMERCDGWSR